MTEHITAGDGRPVFELSDDEVDRLSRLGSKAGRTQRLVLALLLEHDDDDALPTSIRFVFYEAEQLGQAVKSVDGKRRSQGWPPGEQDVIDAAMDLRECGLVPWSWITDETRSIRVPGYGATIAAHTAGLVDLARINPWGDEPPPLVLCESRSLAGVLRATTDDYCCASAATNGQAGGFLRTDVAPVLAQDGVARRVLYLGDLDRSGGHIEDQSRRVLERECRRRGVDVLRWQRVAITEAQVAEHDLPLIRKRDKRTNQWHDAWETEALGQATVVALLRDTLDALLPEPLAVVLEREDEQRQRVREQLGMD